MLCISARKETASQTDNRYADRRSKRDGHRCSYRLRWQTGKAIWIRVKGGPNVCFHAAGR